MSVLRPKLSVCVIGAGNGGVAMAGHLGLKGHQVRLYSRDERKLEAVRHAGGVFVTGAVEGFGPVQCATTSLAEAVDGADVVMVTTPASAHAATAQALAPYLRKQIIVLNPGRQAAPWKSAASSARARQHGSGSANVHLRQPRRSPTRRASTTLSGRCRWPRCRPGIRPAIVGVASTVSAVRSGQQRVGNEFRQHRCDFHPAPSILNASKVDSGVPLIITMKALHRASRRSWSALTRSGWPSRKRWACR